MRENRLTISDLFDPTNSGGIFHFLQSYDVPWKNLTIDQNLDYYYHLNHSGEKNVSPLVKSLVANGSLTDLDKGLLAGTIYAMFGDQWDHIFEALTKEYNPIENYSMTEHEGYGESTSGSASGSTDTDGSTDYQVYGFNSSNPVDSDKSIVDNTVIFSNRDSGSKQSERQLTRSGNIGVTTSQQMLQSELDIRMYNMFINRIFPDIDKVLTIDVY